MTDTTSTKRQARRRTALNQIAQDAGYASWTKFETEIIKKGQITMANAMIDISERVSGVERVRQYMQARDISEMEASPYDVWD